MSSQKTEHYQLHKWEENDDFLRAEFNENFSAIDGALGGHDAALATKADQTALDAVRTLAAGKASIVTGTYAGSGEGTQTIELGFRAAAVMLENQWGTRANLTGSAQAGLFLDGHPLNIMTAVITDTGFTVTCDGRNHSANLNGYTYHYVAFR